MGIFDRRRRCIADADYRFGWVPAGGYPSSAPTLTVAWSGGSQSYALSPVRSADSVSGLSTDGYDLTIVTSVTQPGSTLRGIIAEYGGHAWIDGGAEYQGPVRVLGLVSQTSFATTTTGTAVLRLAEPLPGGLSIVSSQSTATGTIVVGAGAPNFATALNVTIFGTLFEFDTNGGANPGYSGTIIDVEASPGVRCSASVLAGRIAACVTAAALGVTATSLSTTVTLTAAHNGTITPGGDDAATLTCTSLTGASARWALRWLGYSATIPAADVGSSVVRSVAWTLPWTCATGADLPTYVDTVRGLLDVVLVPFDTGLTDEGLYALVPGWRSVVPQAQSSWASQRAAALDELEDLIRPRLPAGRYVDQLLAEQFRPVHALLTAARILQGQESVGYDAQALERYREDAAKALDACLGRLVWLDANDDGIVTTDELGVAAKGISSFAASPVLDGGYDTDGADSRRINPWDAR